MMKLGDPITDSRLPKGAVSPITDWGRRFMRGKQTEPPMCDKRLIGPIDRPRDQGRISRLGWELARPHHDAICARLALHAEIGKHVDLTDKRGGLWHGLCPFCEEGQLHVIEYFRPRGPFYACLAHRAEAEQWPADAETREGIKADPIMMRWWLSRPLPPKTSRSCAAFGDIIGFRMRIENIGYIEAIIALCEEADIEPPRLVFERGPQ